MTGMPLHIGWSDVALRLALTVVAGLLIGYNRTEHGKAAGLRTTLLVCLAASLAMIQVNLLLPMAGRASDSFVTNDLMRLPLGILTGVGFIGGGAILRRDNIISGVTTAATLWYVTVIGLCLGGGQIALGAAATALGLAALWGLERFELRLRREHSATLSLALEGGPLTDDARFAAGSRTQACASSERGSPRRKPGHTGKSASICANTASLTRPRRRRSARRWQRTTG